MIWDVSNLICHPWINTLRLRHNGRHVPDDFFNAFPWMKILIKIPLKFVPEGPINNISAFVQIMAWHRPGDKPLSEPMVVSLLTHICNTRPQGVNLLLTWINFNPNMDKSSVRPSPFHYGFWWNMSGIFTHLWCFIPVINLAMSFKVVSQLLGQSWYCFSGSEVSLNERG